MASNRSSWRSPRRRAPPDGADGRSRRRGRGVRGVGAQHLSPALAAGTATQMDGLGPVLLDALTEADDAADGGTDAWRDRLCTALSCRSALRRGEPLSLAAMRDLLARLGTTESPAVCPRLPIVLHVASAFLTRQFDW